MDIEDVQRRAWANKVAKGFGIDDVSREFALTYGELAEAYDAYRKNPEGLPGELADVVIYVTGIASMCGIDLATAVRDKLAVVEARTYTRAASGQTRNDVPSCSQLLQGLGARHSLRRV